jgi:hypothetical protein
MSPSSRAVDIRDRKIGRVEFSEVSEPLLSPEFEYGV